ncbi:MAG: phage integrase N-terminal SAM-like domain-containing protein [Anaerolineae bacterium]
MLSANVDLTLRQKNTVGSELDIECYLADCQMRRLAPRTLVIYRHQLEAFQAWTHNRPTAAITTQDMRLYFLQLQQVHNPGGQHHPQCHLPRHGRSDQAGAKLRYVRFRAGTSPRLAAPLAGTGLYKVLWEYSDRRPGVIRRNVYPIYLIR